MLHLDRLVVIRIALYQTVRGSRNRCVLQVGQVSDAIEHTGSRRSRRHHEVVTIEGEGGCLYRLRP